jgi:hypothetical protein
MAGSKFRSCLVLLYFPELNEWVFCSIGIQGLNSPTLKLSYLCLWLALEELKIWLEDICVIAELGESQPLKLNKLGVKTIKTFNCLGQQ